MQEIAQEAEGGDAGVARQEVGAVSDIVVFHLLMVGFVGLLQVKRLLGDPEVFEFV